jgi:2-(1,2-epoxy-1,2-dihydrophenyl)acetyl-CoA isomerase
VSARSSTVLCDVQDNIARITLDRQEAANSIDLNLARELMHTVLRCSDDPAVRAVVITGRGSTFCVGGDLRSFAVHREGLSLHIREVTTYLHAAVSRLTRMDPPVIAAVNGTAAGAGMSLVCACDLVLAAESARFTMAYTKVGLTPDGSSTYFLSRLVGLRRALELVLTNRVLSAEEALEWGLVSRVVPDGELAAEADSLASRLASGATAALGASKRLVYGGWTETLETQLEHESQVISDVSRTADGKEGIAAFLEKRAPKFECR